MKKQKRRGSSRILIAAISEQNYEAVKYLLSKGSNINAGDYTGKSPLYHAIWMEDLKMIELLLKNNAKVHLEDRSRCTPYDLAMSLNNIDVLKIIFQHQDRIIMHYNIKFEEYPADLRSLFYRKVDVKYADYYGYTALSLAVKCDDLNGIRTLISRGANVHRIISREKYSLLHLAKSAECIEFLLQKGVEPNVKDMYSCSPLYTIMMKIRGSAAYSVDEEERLRMIEALFRHDADCAEALDCAGKAAGRKAEIESMDGIEELLRFMALLEHERDYLSMDFLRLHDRDYILGSFYRQCLKEVAKLQKKKIFHQLTYYEFLMKNKQELLIYLDNESFIETFTNEYEIPLIFPIYCEILQRHFNDVIEIRRLYETACTSFSYFLDHIAACKIVDFLDFLDMKNLVEAFQFVKVQNNK